MEQEAYITGVLADCKVNKRGEKKVANIEVRSGGQYSKDKARFDHFYYPLEAWLDDQIETLENAPIGSYVYIKYRAVPKKIDTGKFKTKIIVWKCLKIKILHKGGIKNNSAPVGQIAFSEEDL